MKSHFEGFYPLLRTSSLPASATAQAGLIDCRNLKAIALTGRATFDASATGNVTVCMFFSPDGVNYDTTAFSTLTLTCVQSGTVQKTAITEVPDTGWVRVNVINGDSSYAQTAVAVWAAVAYQFIEDRQTQAST